MDEISIRRYAPTDKDAWNAFAESARNGNFLFDRNYMDYHKERFPDCSFLFFKRERICALIPGTLDASGVFSSHAGLTFGGFIVGDSVGASDVKVLFEKLDGALKKTGARTVLYKPLPWIYAEKPSQEDLYWLFRKKAVLRHRLLSCALRPDEANPSAQKRRYLRRGERESLEFSESSDWEGFWEILEECLEQRHHSKPVHSLREMTSLAKGFPQNIRLFTVKTGAEILAGSVVYVSRQVAHAQYLASSPEGRAKHAMDFLMLKLLARFSDKKFLDWGTSNENGGLVLNEGLVRQKEECGGTGIVYDTFEYTL